MIENSPPKLLKKTTVDLELMEWIKERIESSITMFDSAKHWSGAL